MASRNSAKARAAARKQKDKWKTKRWFTIRAPRYPWDFKRIGETLGEEEEHIVGRTYEITQQEFDGDFTKMHVKVRFRVIECVGQDALTEFIGHSHQSDHVRRQIRRYRGKVDDVVDVVTQDGFLVRLKPLMITERRVKSSVKSAMRLAARDVILTQSARKTFAQLQKSLLGTEMEDEVSKAVRKVYPVRSAVIHKSQLLQSGVVSESGPTLDEIHANEERKTAETAARKAAALAAAADEEDGTAEEAGVLAAAEALEEVSDKAPEPVEEVKEEEESPVAAEPASDDDFSTLPGVGPASAKKLQDAGLGSFAALKEAGVDGISEIKGISAALAGKILDHLS
ncbi:helix-hairpin-helix domain-containing protein [Deltaproteobacteria bacterium]|nr:helix-hairpin-helix domain-containing protein [Deltaproteobacteria bacterium]